MYLREYYKVWIHDSYRTSIQYMDSRCWAQVREPERRVGDADAGAPPASRARVFQSAWALLRWAAHVCVAGYCRARAPHGRLAHRKAHRRHHHWGAARCDIPRLLYRQMSTSNIDDSISTHPFNYRIFLTYWQQKRVPKSMREIDSIDILS